jgi:hypothetical protein
VDPSRLAEESAIDLEPGVTRVLTDETPALVIQSRNDTVGNRTDVA